MLPGRPFPSRGPSQPPQTPRTPHAASPSHFGPPSPAVFRIFQSQQVGGRGRRCLFSAHGAPSFSGVARPSLSPPLLYRTGNRGCRFTKPAFPAPSWRPSLPVHARLLAGAVGLPGPKGTRGGGKPGTHRGWQRHRRAWAVDLGSGSLGPLVVPSPQPPSPPLPVSPKAGRSRRPSSCPRSPEAPGVGHAAEVLEGGGPRRRSQSREDGGFRGRPPEEGRKGASDAHHVCGIEYD